MTIQGWSPRALSTWRARGPCSLQKGWLCCWFCLGHCSYRKTGLSPAGSRFGWVARRPCYLEAVGGGQATLLPEAEGALQLL